MADNYQHSITKFADTGLELRLPVDLVPETKYSRLTNAVPVIEGQLISRDGVTEIAYILPVNTVTKLILDGFGHAIGLQTSSPHGYVNGDFIELEIDQIVDASGSAPLGSIQVQITSIPTSVTFNFVPQLPATG